jgi:hypothetical protein
MQTSNKKNGCTIKKEETRTVGLIKAGATTELPTLA